MPLKLLSGMMKASGDEALLIMERDVGGDEIVLVTKEALLDIAAPPLRRSATSVDCSNTSPSSATSRPRSSTARSSRPTGAWQYPRPMCLFGKLVTRTRLEICRLQSSWYELLVTQ